jgi:aspartate racemase
VHSAKILLYSIDFAEKKKLLDNNDWNRIASCYCEVALKLENAGADCLVLCANTPHTIADEIIKAIHIPLIHIAEATADEIAKQQLKKVGLLGTNNGTKLLQRQAFSKRNSSVYSRPNRSDVY